MTTAVNSTSVEVVDDTKRVLLRLQHLTVTTAAVLPMLRMRCV